MPFNYDFGVLFWVSTSLITACLFPSCVTIRLNRNRLMFVDEVESKSCWENKNCYRIVFPELCIRELLKSAINEASLLTKRYFFWLSSRLLFFFASIYATNDTIKTAIHSHPFIFQHALLLALRFESKRKTGKCRFHVSPIMAERRRVERKRRRQCKSRRRRRRRAKN